ncbi:MAG: oxygen-dependent coproporphyrinogen oxidase [Bdellovibrionaceae bacterium]|nr:oxygen-dependent coproporphyrinogen oxidase [Pseudobdellovibrionaceae bacterium]
MESKNFFVEQVRKIQNDLIAGLQSEDPSIRIKETNWERKDFLGHPGGGGRTVALEGEVIENAGVNTSLIFGGVNPEFAKKLGSETPEVWATGISTIIHPKNPRVPSFHANFRMIQSGEKIWFGGGADLTPFYPNEEDFRFFHQKWKNACDPYQVYESMKQSCDEYFVNSHRGTEMRGIGGIFFDYWNSGNMDHDMKMVTELSETLVPSYLPLVNKRKNEKYTEADEDFQLHRRGRYVEFNLIHDRGTTFGLQTGGNTDSILISLPARCKFTYQYQPEPGSPHEKMMEYYQPKDWTAL